MDAPNTPAPEPAEIQQEETFEPPAIMALGKLDEVTFGAAGPPFEGATSYL